MAETKIFEVVVNLQSKYLDFFFFFFLQMLFYYLKHRNSNIFLNGEVALNMRRKGTLYFPRQSQKKTLRSFFFFFFFFSKCMRVWMGFIDY